MLSPQPTVRLDEHDHVTFSRFVDYNSESPWVSDGVVTVSSPLKYTYWCTELSDHPDQSFVSEIMDYMTNGAPTGYNGPNVHMENSNWPSVDTFSSHVRHTMVTDSQKQRFIGPFKSKPFQNIICSPMGAFMKKRSCKVRTIHDLSYPAGSSINDFIDKSECSLKYKTIDDAVSVCQDIRKQHNTNVVYGAKLDLKDAFKHIIVRPEEWHLLGSTWNNGKNGDTSKDYWFSTVLQFGMRSSPKLFDKFAEALQYMMERNGATNIVRIMDDFGTFAHTAEECNKNLRIMLEVCRKAGFEVQPTKVVWATTLLEFLGIIIDNYNQQLKISEERIREITELLSESKSKVVFTKRQLLSLIGKLTFCSKVVRCGKTFTRRLIELSKKVKHLHQKIRLSRHALEDIRWWSQSLVSHNGVCFFPSDWVSDEVCHLYTDASDLAISGTYGNAWFYRCFVGSYFEFKSKPIVYRELLALVVCLATFGRHLSHKRLVLHIDNIAVVHIVNNVYSKCSDIMVLVRKLYHIMSQYKMECKAVYINTKANTWADSLSRLNVNEFHRLNPCAEPTLTWPEYLELDGIIY